MSQPISKTSQSRSLQRPSAIGTPSYPEDTSSDSRNMNGKRLRDDVQEDQVGTPRKLVRQAGDHHRERDESRQPSKPVGNVSNLVQEREFVDGPGHIVFIDERGKRCPAICFNKALLSTFNHIAAMSLEVQQRDVYIREAQFELEQIKSSNQSADLEKAKKKVEAAVKDQEEVEAAIPELVDARRQYEDLVQENKWPKMVLENSRELALLVTEEILRRGNLLNIPLSKPQKIIESTKDHTSKPAPAPEETVDHIQRSNVSDSSQATSIARPHPPIINEEHFTPHQLALRRFRQAAAELDYRNEQHALIQEEYTRDFPGRPASATQTDLDLEVLQKKQKATRKAIEAEEAYDRAGQHAEALGLGDILADPHACFWGEHYNEFAPNTPTTPSVFPVDRSWIENWMSSIPDAAAVDPQWQEHAELVGGDDWEAKPVEIFDSVSVVARDMYRKKIDRWQELSGRCGRAEAEGPLPKVGRRNPRRRCRNGLSSGKGSRARS